MLDSTGGLKIKMFGTRPCPARTTQAYTCSASKESRQALVFKKSFGYSPLLV